MIRRDLSFNGKADQNGNPAPSPSVNGSPLTVLRPVSVLPSGSGVSSAAASNGSPVLYLLASPNGMPRFSTPQSQNSNGPPQSGPRVLLLQIPSKSVQQSQSLTASTPQPQKIVSISTAAPNSLPLKRPMQPVIVQQNPVPNTVSQLLMTRTEDSGPPVKRFALTSPLGSLVRPINIQSAANMQQVSCQSGTSTIKIIPASAVPSPSFSSSVSTSAPLQRQGANLARLEQARSAVRAAVQSAESRASPVPVSVVQNHVAKSYSPSTLASQHAQLPSKKAASAAPISVAPEVKPPSLVEQGMLRCINHDRKVATSQMVPGVRLQTWHRMSEAVLALIPFHIHDTVEPPLIDRLEHDLAFAARCQKLLARKDRLKDQISKILLFNEQKSREQLDEVLTNRLLIEGLNKDEKSSCEDAEEETSLSPAQHLTSQPSPKETPKMSIKLGNDRSSSTPVVVSHQLHSTASGPSHSHHVPLKNMFGDEDDVEDFILPMENEQFSEDHSTGSQSWTPSNISYRPPLILRHHPHHRTSNEASNDASGSLSEADLAVQSIL